MDGDRPPQLFFESEGLNKRKKIDFGKKKKQKIKINNIKVLTLKRKLVERFNKVI